MIKAVLFDFGGVLAEEGFREGLRAIAGRAGLAPESVMGAGERLVYETGYVLGRSDERTFWEALRGETGTVLDDTSMREDILSRFVLRPRVLRWVRRLRDSGKTVGILSDQTDWLEELDRRHGFFAEFDCIFNSFRLGKGKRDSTLFRDVCAWLGLASGEVVFVDDRKGNLERARGFGIRTIHYVSYEGFEKELLLLLNEG